LFKIGFEDHLGKVNASKHESSLHCTVSGEFTFPPYIVQ